MKKGLGIALAFILIIALVTAIVIGWSWLCAKFVVWLGVKLGLTIPFNIAFFVLLVWNLVLGGGGAGASSRRD